MEWRHVMAIAMVLGGCGASGDPPGQQGDSLTPEEAGRAGAAAMCTWMVRCGITAASEEARCADGNISPDGLFGSYDVREAVAAGRVHWNGEAAARCIRSIAEGGCGLLPLPSLDCATVIEGRVAPGGSCMEQRECAGGWCDQGRSTTAGCPGTCRARLAEGASCIYSSQCGTGLFCQRSTARCAPIATARAACHEADECGPTRMCGGNLLGGATGACVEPGSGGDGAACTPFLPFECKPDFYCDASSGAAVCRPRVSEGAACLERFACTAGLVCAIPGGGQAGRCVHIADVGDACDPHDTPLASACPLTLGCNPATRTCDTVLNPSKVGEPCDYDFQCSDFDLYCKVGACAERPRVGQACDATEGDPCRESACDRKSGTCVLQCG